MPGLRDEKSFVRWAVADGVSVMGTSVSTVVLPLVVYQTTGSSAATGGLFALRIIPYILFGAVAGPVADRKNRRRLIVGGHIIEGVLGATIPIAALFGVLTVAQVYAVGLLSACAFVFSDAAVFGAVPAMVGTDRLAAANGFLGSMVSGAEIAGPALGGVLASTIGATNAVWFDCFSFFFAAAVQGSIRSTFRIGEPPTGPLRIKEQIGKAIRFVRGNRSVATLLLTGFGNSLGFGAVLGLLVPYAVEQLGLPEKDLRVGLMFSASGFGALISGLLFSRVFAPIRVKWITPIAITASAMVAMGLAFSTSWVAAAFLLVLFSWSIGTTVTTGITYRQLAAPDELRSSVNVFGRMISWGGQPFGAGIGAFVSSVFDVRAAYIVAAVSMSISAVCALVFLRPSTALHPITPPA
ncbi:MAG: major facilitator superfamily 1 [Acidimicrobiales bacterium]|nr:major facilitator superfamily 1 [Acidimicrobiales bacterium]